MQDELNPTLAKVLDTAAEIQETRDGLTSPEDAIRYAVLVRLEQELRLPVMVKYGDAEAIQAEMGRSNDRVWGATPGGDWNLFRIEPERDLSPNEQRLVDRTLAAIGAWYVGETSPRQVNGWAHRHYAWPDDHPVRGLLPRTE